MVREKAWISSVLLALLAPDCWAQWIAQESGTKARLRGVSVVSDEIAWASGANGTVLRTIDRGGTWRARPVLGAPDLDFRDIQAIDAKTAFLLSIGEGSKSRLYKTTDGAASWALQYTNPDPKGFLDAIAFWDADHGLALGDPVDGRFTILTTEDGGTHWKKAAAEEMPTALASEGAFAASGTCLVTFGTHHAWFGSGGGKTARVFRTEDRGRTWTVHETPVRCEGPTSGIFSLSFRDAEHGVAVGGIYDKPERGGRVVARTEDGGKTWALATGAEPGGFRSAVVFVRESSRWITVGPSGGDVSTDDGRSWRSLGPGGFHAIGTADGAIWAVGEDGKIARFEGQAAR